LGTGRGHARAGHRDGQRDGRVGLPLPLGGAPSGLVFLVGRFGMLAQVLIEGLLAGRKRSWPARISSMALLAAQPSC
jgi:hypothetical protein